MITLSVATDGYLSGDRRTLDIVTQGYLSNVEIIDIPIPVPSPSSGGFNIPRQHPLVSRLAKDDMEIILISSQIILRNGTFGLS